MRMFHLVILSGIHTKRARSQTLKYLAEKAMLACFVMKDRTSAVRRASVCLIAVLESFTCEAISQHNVSSETGVLKKLLHAKIIQGHLRDFNPEI